MPIAFLQIGKNLAYNERPVYDTKLSDDEGSVVELWEMWNTLSLPLLSSSLWPGFNVPVRVSSMGQKELLNFLLYLKTI